MATEGAPLSSLSEATARPAPSVALDNVDLALLRLLVADARMSQRRLARELGMSPPAIGERIARLERTGVVRGYTVRLGWDVLGYPVTVQLAITAVQGSDLGAVVKALRALPEVEDVTVVTGAIDLLARLRVRDYTHLQELLLQHVWQISGVQRTETFLGIAQMRPKDFGLELIDSMTVSEERPQAQKSLS